MMGQLGSAWSQPLDNGQQARQHAEDSLYGQATSRLDPMWNQREQQFKSDLTNQGIDPNSAAGQQAYGNFGRDRNDAYQGAINSAGMLGGQEASRQQGMDLQSRMAPLGAMAGLQGLSGMPQNPLLPAAMAQYQGALQNYGIQQQGKDSHVTPDPNDDLLEQLTQAGLYPQQIAQLQRQYQLAQGFMQPQEAQGRQVGGTYVAASPWEHLANAIRPVVGALMQRSAQNREGN
jgi:hypothetical protein